MIGFVLGVLVGAFLADNATDQQRRRAAESASRAGRRIRDSSVGRAVADNAGQVANTATDRVVDAVDTAGDTVADAIGNGERQSV